MIIWGKKAVYRHLGYVADFCPICLCAAPFSLERVGMAGHIYYITAGEGDLVGYQRNCLACNVLLNAVPDRYATFAKKVEPMPELIRQTFPRLAEFHKDRLVLEHQVRTALSTIAEDTRRSLIMEPFQLLAPKVVTYFAATHFEMGRTFMRREIVPVLAKTLARLRPTEQELQAVLTRLAQMREVIGSRLKLADLMAGLDSVRAHTPAGGGTVFGTRDSANPYAHAGATMRAPGMRAGGALLPYEKAARIFTVLAWIEVAGIVLLGGGELFSGKPLSHELMWVMAVLTGVTGAMFYASAEIKRHTKLGRILGIVLGSLLLFWFPIGTIIGASALWYLIKGWGDEESAAQTA
ncbi:hypothetical protein [Massilia sp. TSP1-1-2]|uniref:hypothetical protein n=1 Tax=unclassified Massilia TaxID=2609279 RepID=UPI003CF8E837